MINVASMPLTISSLNEDSKQDERIEHSPEDLTPIVLHEADEPLIVDLRRGLGRRLLDRFHLAWSERRVAVPRVDPIGACRRTVPSQMFQIVILSFGFDFSPISQSVSIVTVA